MKITILLCIIIVVLLVIYWCTSDNVEEVAVQSKYRGFCPDSDPWDMPLPVENILTPDECQEIIKLADGRFHRSGIVGKSGPDLVRTSETAWIPKTEPIVAKVLEKACELTGKTIDNCEEMQVVRYHDGQYYRPHHDSCCDPDDSCITFEENGGQRVGTLLIYLNNEFEGGETDFPNLKARFRAQAGTGVFFRPMNKSGKQCHPLALHGGLPPTNGTKYACNIWVRENKFVKP
jgi:2OG-Fe(II) oxygenase superfamily